MIDPLLSEIPVWETEAAAVALVAAGLVALALAWWGGRRLAARTLLGRGPGSVRHGLTRRCGVAGAAPLLWLLAITARVAPVLLVARALVVPMGHHPLLADFLQTAQAGLDRWSHSTTAIVLFDAAVIAAGTWALLRTCAWLARRFARWRRELPERQRRGARGRFRLVGASTVRRLGGVIAGLLWALQVAAMALLAVLYASGVFSLFPVTRDWVATALAAVREAMGGVGASVLHYLPNLANLLVIGLVTYGVLKLLRFIAAEIRRGAIEIPGFYAEWAQPTYQLARVLTLALSLVAAFPFLPGSDSPVFHGMSVFFGVLISLGSTSFIANIVAGVVLTYTRGFRVGDRVRIADTQGDVVEKGLLVTRVRTIKNVDVTIPNSLVMSSHMVNYSSVSRDRHLILCTTVTLSYDLPWRMVHETLVKAALATPGILQNPRPFVMQTSLNDYHVSYELNAYTDDPNSMHALYSGLHQSMQDACNAAGFEILSPGYAAIRDGNASTIPADKRPAGHADPAFRVELRPPGPPSAS